jgi:DMSO/TMAO reductase YedYZ molybdopterin-dependent catalytic subunit
MNNALITRRGGLLGAAGGAGLLLSGCNQITQSSSFQQVANGVAGWNLTVQRFLISGGHLAPQYPPGDITKIFKANGTTDPDTDEYNQHVAEKFANWRLTIDGLVANPLSLSMADLRKLPARTQITRHDCVEGWSCIGQWTGVQLGLLLRSAAISPRARYAVFHCADNLDGEASKGGEQSAGQYYESIDLDDAFHPQTLMAYDMNGQPLGVPHGAPVRLRVERQLGYKHAKYVQRIQLVDNFSTISGGKGGYWEDRGYEWYAGI